MLCFLLVLCEISNDIFIIETLTSELFIFPFYKLVQVAHCSTTLLVVDIISIRRKRTFLVIIQTQIMTNLLHIATLKCEGIKRSCDYINNYLHCSSCDILCIQGTWHLDENIYFLVRLVLNIYTSLSLVLIQMLAFYLDDRMVAWVYYIRKV